MIVIGGFGFVLAWCLAPYIIKGTKTAFSCFYVFMIIALSVTYGLPILVALFPYMVGLIIIIGIIMAIMFINDNRKDREFVHSDKYKKTNERWNAKKEIAKLRLKESGKELTDYNVVMGAYDVKNEDADKFIEKDLKNGESI